ncbi:MULTISPECIES: stalk domain-containing protein [Paenibacillus]|uniref:stalk domain-containing protein n=1 Tax=Paenibacillus TaxID=44249 RepID=UPI00203C8225|nr:stalk domain-containing protein [Paenibacillus camelliae]MCM3632196.1 copper amine oxidase N-terminal domain-containing protein [Paenibacillus camelliae]
MKGKKLLLLVCVVMIWSSTIIFANASSQKIKVLVNGINIGEVGVLFENTTYLPLRKVGESLNAIVEWNSNSKTAVIYDPNVHMFVYNSSNGAETTFGEVSKGFSGKIKIFAQVDNVQFKLNSVKFAIVDPSGKETLIQKIAVDKERDNYWFVTDETSYRFSSSGNYVIRCYMQTEFSDEWVVTSEKIISST